MATDELLVGGSELIDTFLIEALRLGSSRTWILVPYVERAALEGDLLRHSWNRLAAVSSVRIVVRSREAADAVRLSLQKPERIDLRIEPTLHAKLFVSTSAAGCVALVGSQNLTSAALHTNIEAGLFVRGTRSPELRRLVANLCARAELVARRARPWRSADR